jgi:hypothetical protein
METSLKQKWVEALRSKKYKQGKSALRSTDNEFCCLGVLCDVIDPNVWRNPENTKWTSNYEYLMCTRLLPYSIAQCQNLPQTQLEKLMNMNDDGKPFTEIADYIEVNVHAQ